VNQQFTIYFRSKSTIYSSENTFQTFGVGLCSSRNVFIYLIKITVKTFIFYSS